MGLMILPGWLLRTGCLFLLSLGRGELPLLCTGSGVVISLSSAASIHLFCLGLCCTGSTVLVTSRAVSIRLLSDRRPCLSCGRLSPERMPGTCHHMEAHCI